MTEGLFFNVNGKTHSLRLRKTDECDGGVGVWEALVDGREYIHFEFPENAEVWALFGEAIERYMEYCGDLTTERRDRR
jgi:hypothetical protein